MMLPKFRAWDKKTKKIRDVLEMGFEDDWILLEGVNARRHKEVKLMQRTGLKDKNGKDIYEGDIVYGKNDYYKNNKVVEWYDKKSGFYLTGVDQYPKDHEGYTSYYRGEYINPKTQEIIGNIHENPELLNIIS